MSRALMLGDAITEINKLRSMNPNMNIVFMSDEGIFRYRLDECLLYESDDGDLVIDAERY